MPGAFAAPDQLRQLKAVHLGHLHVQQGQGHIVVGQQQFQGLRARLGLEDVQPVTLQQRLQGDEVFPTSSTSRHLVRSVWGMGGGEVGGSLKRDACARIKAAGAGAGPPAALQCLQGQDGSDRHGPRWLPAAWWVRWRWRVLHDGEAARRLNGLAGHARRLRWRSTAECPPAGAAVVCRRFEQHVDGFGNRTQGRGSTDSFNTKIPGPGISRW